MQIIVASDLIYHIDMMGSITLTYAGGSTTADGSL
jgi:hypothetical protein